MKKTYLIYALLTLLLVQFSASLAAAAPATVKGVVYSPVPLGIDPEVSPPYGDYFTLTHSNIWKRDLALLRGMGANTIRVLRWDINADHTDFLNAAYNGGVDPIYVIVTFWMDPNKYPDISSPEAREQIKVDFGRLVASLKKHPAIRMWSIGNELNAPWMYGSKLDDLFRLINEMAEVAHAKEGIKYHPVTTPLLDKDLVHTIGTYESSMISLDVWGANVYRGQSFGTFFDDYRGVSNKPLLILGFGIDAFDNRVNDEYEITGIPYQALYAKDLWTEIQANSDVGLGGLVMEYSDEWWKGKSPYSGVCRDYFPSVHSKCGYASGAHPDGYSNEAWWGIMRPVDHGDGLNVMEPRESYYALQSMWQASVTAIGQGQNSVTTKALAQTLAAPICPSSLTFGETALCSISASGEEDSYSFTGSAGDKVLLSMAVSAGFALDPQIRLLGPGGTEVCSSFNASGGFAEIKECTLPSAGAHTILANDYGETETGDYGLFLQQLNQPGNATATTPGQVLSASIGSVAETDTYSYTGSAGDKVLISMAVRAGFALDPQIRLLGPDGAEVCSAFNASGGFAEIKDCTLPRHRHIHDFGK